MDNEILETYYVVSHVGGFRKFGYEWGNQPKLLGVVKELPKRGRFASADVDCLATEAEVNRIEPLTKAPKYPLRLTKAGDSTAQATVDKKRRELDVVAGVLAAANGELDERRRELDALAERREALRAEVVDLERAVKAAEDRAIAAENRAEALESGEPAKPAADATNDPGPIESPVETLVGSDATGVQAADPEGSDKPKKPKKPKRGKPGQKADQAKDSDKPAA